MFTRSYRLFSILGFQIGIDLSWFFLAALIIWSLGSGVFPYLLPGETPVFYYSAAVVGALGLFASIIFHELAHALVARYYEIKISGITLFLFGGVAELEDEPPTAKSEFLVAIAGPISSYLLAGILFVLSGFFSQESWPGPNRLLYYLMIINLMLATFNLIPAFPLDGGRMLRAGIWGATGSLKRATRVASYLGVGLGGTLMLFGAYNGFTGNTVGGMWQILIGFFIIGAANSSRQQVEILEALRGVKASELMKSVPLAIPGDVPVSEITSHPQLAGSNAFLPVTDDQGIIGLFQPSALAEIPQEQRGVTPLRKVAKPLKPAEIVNPEQTAISTLRQLRRARGHQAYVMSGGRLQGLIEARDIFAFIDRHMRQRDAQQDAASG